MEKKFKPDKWTERCKQCKWVRPNAKYKLFGCGKLDYCEFEKADKPIPPDFEFTNHYKSGGLGKVCPRCHKYFLFDDASPTSYTKDGQPRYSYCRECRNINQHESYMRRMRKKQC